MKELVTLLQDRADRLDRMVGADCPQIMIDFQVSLIEDTVKKLIALKTV